MLALTYSWEEYLSIRGLEGQRVCITLTSWERLKLNANAMKNSIYYKKYNNSIKWENILVLNEK